MEKKLKDLETKKKKIAVVISTIASSLIILSTLIIILSTEHQNTEIKTVKDTLNSKVQISTLQIVLLFIFSIGITHTIYFLKKHYIEIAKKIKKIKKGIKAEKEALKILKEYLNLQNIQTNKKITENNNNINTDIDIIATSEKLKTPISIEVKGLKGTVKIEDNKLLFQNKALNVNQIKTIKKYMEKTFPNSKIMVFFPYAKIETNSKHKRKELKQKGYTEIEIFKTKVLISNSYFIKNI